MKAFRDITISTDGLKIIEEEWSKHNSVPVCSIINYWSNRMNLQIIEGVTHSLHLVGVFIGDVEAELLLESHHQLDGVQ